MFAWLAPDFQEAPGASGGGLLLRCTLDRRTVEGEGFPPLRQQGGKARLLSDKVTLSMMASAEKVSARGERMLLRERLGLSTRDFESLLAVIASQLDVSLSELLAEEG